MGEHKLARAARRGRNRFLILRALWLSKHFKTKPPSPGPTASDKSAWKAEERAAGRIK